MLIKIKRILKNYYRWEMKKIKVPESPFSDEEAKENRTLSFILSFALTVLSVFTIISGINSKPSALAEDIAVFSEHYEIDKVILNGIDYIKTVYTQIFKEE